MIGNCEIVPNICLGNRPSCLRCLQSKIRKEPFFHKAWSNASGAGSLFATPSVVRDLLEHTDDFSFGCWGCIIKALNVIIYDCPPFVHSPCILRELVRLIILGRLL
jgi:hypothetical protein